MAQEAVERASNKPPVSMAMKRIGGMTIGLRQPRSAVDKRTGKVKCPYMCTLLNSLFNLLGENFLDGFFSRNGSAYTTASGYLPIGGRCGDNELNESKDKDSLESVYFASDSNDSFRLI